MNRTVEFLLQHGYLLLFAFVLAEQSGLPIPSTPMLLAAGALAGLGRMNLAFAWLLAIIASLIGDTLWFMLGRLRGFSILNVFCRISLEPDTCVQKTQTTYSRHGVNWLLFAKFVPGLSTIAPPMAGMFKVTPWRFLGMDTGGALLWSGAYLMVGWIFRDQLEVVADLLARLGSSLIVVLVGAIVLYIAFKYIQRQRVYRDLRIARITPQELKRSVDKGDKVIVIDLRSEFEQAGGRIPGSLVAVGDNVEQLVGTIDKTTIAESEVVLYCSCPNEISSARAALRLKSHGLKRVRPLEGGFPVWKELGFPVEMPARNNAEVRQ
jgi:membrane protein DedA with SNARE-associated domain/rhodanese-related sulfurtransferase